MSETLRLTFPGAFGVPLSARLHKTAGTPRAYALFAHCFTCGKDLRTVVRIGRELAARGIATLRFDFTGLGESEGDFADTDFSSNVDDLVAAADYLREEHGAPSILIGHSLGGAAVIAAAHRIEEVMAVATIGAPFDPEHVRHLIDAEAPDLAERGVCRVRIAGRAFTVKRELLDDLAAQSSAEVVRTLGRALLLFHSPQDEVVSIDNAREIYVAARHPKSFVSLDGADHLLSRAADAEYVAVVLAAWATRYLPATAPGTPLEPGEVRVDGGPSGFRTLVTAGTHEWVADEPRSIPGGADAGPNPYDHLLAALGTCTAMTLRMYATRKELPLEAVRVTSRHRRVHANDCESCESEAGLVDVIDRELALSGPLDEAQRARLLEIADKCPVHRTLTSETVIHTRLEPTER
jgi:putative redox protein